MSAQHTAGQAARSPTNGTSNGADARTVYPGVRLPSTIIIAEETMLTRRNLLKGAGLGALACFFARLVHSATGVSPIPVHPTWDASMIADESSVFDKWPAHGRLDLNPELYKRNKYRLFAELYGGKRKTISRSHHV